MEDIKPSSPNPTGPPVKDITAPLPAPVGAKFEEAGPATPAAPITEPDSPSSSANVQPAPAAESAEVDDAPQSEAEEKADVLQPAEQPKPKAAKQHGSGFAIFAAILIILGLGAMFTYAYLQTQ